MMSVTCFAAILLLLATTVRHTLASLGPLFHSHPVSAHVKRPYFPKPASNVTTIQTPSNVTIRYKIPSNEGICEITPGVNSYSGYVDLAPNVHVFFWFFESRRDPANDDITLWLNGGPGGDSLIGLFTEIGPCRINEEFETYLNPYSWTNVSNMLFLSQPVGVGFSKQGVAQGIISNFTGSYLNVSQAEALGETDVIGTWPLLDPLNKGTIDTTALAAVATWEILQGFLSGLPQLSGNRATSPKNFNLWTESYGGHYGPSFFHYFQKQNVKIQNGSVPGYELNFKNLGIINGFIDERVQAFSYPEFAVNNTYGIKVYNDTVYDYVKFATHMPGLGYLDQIETCIQAAQRIPSGYVSGRITNVAARFPPVASLCSEAANMCTDNVEGPYYAIGDRNVYDVRYPLDTSIPDLDSLLSGYLNQAHVQDAIGVSLNYSLYYNADIYPAFLATGDFIYPNFLKDLEDILNSGVRVTLAYGDADYICNWFGGEAISLTLNYTHSKEFSAAGYEPFLWSDAKLEASVVREYGNLSFVRVFDAGHVMPFYVPGPALELFERAISGVDIAQGTRPITANFSTNGAPNATHTQDFVFLPLTESASLAAWSASLVASYSSLVVAPEPTG